MIDHPSLKKQINSGAIAIAPGIYDALGAVLVEQADFHVAYLSGASIAYSRFGRPDIGLVGMSEVAATLSAIKERVDLPIIVDADTGFGNALNVQRTVRLFERNGANGIQLEDQTMPKRCGHLTGKTLVSTGDMVGKIRAALDARHNADTLIIARTDAVAVEGFEAALERAERYTEAGADILFIEAPQSVEQMHEIVGRFKGRVPLLANMVEGGKTPQTTAGDLDKIGFSVVIFPGGLVRAFAHMAKRYFSSLHEHGTTMPFAEHMLNFEQLNDFLGTEDMLSLGRTYDSETSEAAND